MTINIYLWAFILLCIAAAPVVLVIAFCLIIAVFIIIAFIITGILKLVDLIFGTRYLDGEENINSHPLYEDDPDYNPEYIPPKERK